MFAHWLEMLWLIGMICVSSLVGHVVAHWLVMWRLIGRKWARFFCRIFGVSLVGYVVAHWLEM